MKKITWFILPLICVTFGAVVWLIADVNRAIDSYYFPATQDKDVSNQKGNGGVKNVTEQGLESTGNRLLGEWQSMEDDKYKIEYVEGGTFIESYGDTETTRGRWKLLNELSDGSDSDGPYLVLEDGVLVRSFSVAELGPENLWLIYLERGNNQHFKKGVDSHSDFYGTWEWRSLDGASTFDLTLRSGTTSNSVVGDYCVFWQHGKRIDCADEEGSLSIYGIISNGEAQITFTSWYYGDVGKAVLTKSQDGMDWKVIEGRSYFPVEATMTQQ